MGVDTREIGEGEDRTLTPMVVQDSTAMESLVRGEIDIQIRTAKAYPRSIARFKAELRDAVRESRETAASCYYTLPQGGKRVEGPSVRMSELAISSWQNARIGARIISESDTHVVLEGVGFDLERNVAYQVQVRRRITDSKGNRYSEDLITKTTNAGLSIARRNVTWMMIPRVHIRDAYAMARTVAAGDAKDLDSGRKGALAAFAKLGVTPEQIFRYCGKQGEADLTTEDLADLLGVKTAIEDGDTTAESVFGKPEADSDTPGRRTFGNQAIKPQAPAGNGKEKEKEQEPTPPVTQHPRREPKVDRNDFWNEADKALKGNHSRATVVVQKTIDDLKALKKLPADVLGWQDVSGEQARLVLDTLKGAK